MDCCSNPLCECPPGKCHCTPDHCYCDMRGLLQFTLLWELTLAGSGGAGVDGASMGGGGKSDSKGATGQDLADKVERRRGYRPSPGTLYPALKALAERGLVKMEREGRTTHYQLTTAGREGFEATALYFVRSFGDVFQRYGS